MLYESVGRTYENFNDRRRFSSLKSEPLDRELALSSLSLNTRHEIGGIRIPRTLSGGNVGDEQVLEPHSHFDHHHDGYLKPSKIHASINNLHPELVSHGDQ
eukprot:Colp12_sorted_trinity150504_noHs@842